MFRLITILLLLSTELAGQVEPKSYEVYSTIIFDNLRTRGDSVHQFFLVCNETRNDEINDSIDGLNEFIVAGEPVYCSYCDNLNDLLRTDSAICELLNDLQKVKEEKKVIERKLLPGIAYELITRRKFERILKKKDRLAYLQGKYYDYVGMIEFSAVAFKNDYAAVYCGLYISPLNAVGTIYILKKHSGKWIIISRPEFWVS